MNALVDLARRTYGRLDVMIDNAGIMQLKVDEWERMIDVNIKGVLYGIAAALSVTGAEVWTVRNVSSTADRYVLPTGAG